jgi:pyrophosphatase PpaX
MPLTVLFDLDGTLVDSIELIQRSKDYAFAAMGRPAPSDREWLTGVGIPLRAMFSRYADTPAEVQEFIRLYREYQIPNHDRLVRSYDGATTVLRTLRDAGHPIGIVTSKSVELSERGLRCVELYDYIDTIVGADSLALHKPDPAPVHLALERLGTNAGEAVFIGDSVHDMQAGNAAGVVTIGALWGPFGRDELLPANPHHLLDDISGLPALLAELA